MADVAEGRPNCSALGAAFDVHGIAVIALRDGIPVWANTTASSLVAGAALEGSEQRLTRALQVLAPLPDLGTGSCTVPIRFAADHALLELDAAVFAGANDEVLLTFQTSGARGPIEDPHVARLEAMLEATSEIITVIDSDGVVRSSNGAAGRITGLAGAEVNGRSFVEFLHPDDVPAATDTFVRGVVAGEHVPPLDLRLRVADGRWHNVEAVVTPSSLVIDGLACSVVTLRDVTERVRRESELEATRRRLEHLVEDLDEVIVVLNEDLSVQWSSPSIERLVDAPAYTNVGENAFNDMHEDDVADVIATIGEVMREPGARRQTTMRLLHARDGWRTVEASIVNRLEDEAVRGLVCTLRHIADEHNGDGTPRRMYARDREEMVRLREADRVKDSFLASLSHEMRTPLTAVVGFAQVLADDRIELGDEERAGVVRRIGANGRELSEMVERLLDFSVLQAGRAAVSLGPVAIAEVVTDLIDRLAHHLRDREVQVEADEGAVATADPRAVDHVVRNLLTNAVRYSSAGSPITVRVRRLEDEVTVDVIDRGIGIAVEDQARVFQSFYRVAPAATGQRGTGIGLNIARRYAQLQGGRLHLTSTLGEGSTFTLVLPTAPGAG